MRLPRARFTLRRMMAAVLVMGLMLGGYVGLLRFRPTLLKAMSDQTIATVGAKAAYLNAKLTREVAEIAVVEHESGEYKKQELQTVPGEISLADAERKRGEDVLVRFAKHKTIQELKSDVEKARSDEQASKETYEREQSAERNLAGLVKTVDLLVPERVRESATPPGP